tara:strand:+ start:350 stop:712 length:363 start_codon:yes stop_codon:yes gene_type:complete
MKLVADNKEFIFRDHRENKKDNVLWKSHGKDGYSLACPWFISNALQLVPNAQVVTTAKTCLQVADGTNYKRCFTIYFDHKTFFVDVLLDDPYLWTKKDYFAFDGFCLDYGLTFEENLVDT